MNPFPTVIRRGSATCLLLAAVSQLCGCAGPTPRLDHVFGERVSQLTAQQTMHPRAGENTDQVLGMDGPSATTAYEQYQKSFSSPATSSSAFTIGVGK